MFRSTRSMMIALAVAPIMATAQAFAASDSLSRAHPFDQVAGYQAVAPPGDVSVVTDLALLDNDNMDPPAIADAGTLPQHTNAIVLTGTTEFFTADLPQTGIIDTADNYGMTTSADESSDAGGTSVMVLGNPYLDADITVLSAAPVDYVDKGFHPRHMVTGEPAEISGGVLASAGGSGPDFGIG